MNLDGAGRGTGGRDMITVSRDEAWTAYFRDLSDRLDYEFEVNDNLSVHSDHFPYFLLGYPSATLRSQDATAGMIGRGYGHTEADTVDKVSPRGLQMGAAFAARVAARLACESVFPTGVRSQDDVRQVLEDDDKLDVLEHHWGRDNRADRPLATTT
jgi:aminopeptidase YwaD